MEDELLEKIRTQDKLMLWFAWIAIGEFFIIAYLTNEVIN